ncbi:MAG TPA: DUF4230 domain-containing protein [Candidatus Eubacterium faecavium]|nr:DUF4230 domain-containing protein [Candidatus Eubacterium faecavium]
MSLIIGLIGGAICGAYRDDILLNIMLEKYSNSITEIIEDKLEKQAELNTGLYQQTSSYDSGDLYNNKVAEKLKVNSKSMKFTYTGYVEAGIQNLADAKVNINAKTNDITIDNIKIEITNVYIDPSSITDTKQSKNIFNQLTIEDFTNSQTELEEKLISDAKENGLIEEAQENAQETLVNIFGDAVDGYDVQFNWG